MRSKLHSLIPLLATTLITCIAMPGCGTSFNPTRTAIHNALHKGNYPDIAQYYLDNTGNPTYDTGDLAEMLIAAKAFHDAGYWKLSSQAFSRAERQLLWKADQVDTPEEFANIVAQTLINDTVGPYRGHIFEGILINYYQALNAIMLGNEDDARVALNRAEVRQDNAQYQLDNLERVSSQAGRQARDHVHNGFDSDSLNTVTQNARRNAIKSIDPIQETRNNAVDMTSLVFRMTSGARSDGNKVDQLAATARASASTQNARNVVDKTTSKGAKTSGQIFVIYEDGTGPFLIENRHDIWFNQYYHHSPSIAYAGIALPEFIPGKTGPGTLIIHTDTNTTSTIPLTFIDQHAGKEFQARFDGILARAMVSAFLKVVGQSVVNQALTNSSVDSDNTAAGNATAAFISTLTGIFTREVLTKADTRAWINLPHSIQIATIPRPDTGILRLEGNLSGSLRIRLPSQHRHGNVLILARAARPGGRLTAYVRELPGTVGTRRQQTAMISN